MKINEYQQSIQYLYNLQYSGIKLGLANINRLLEYLNNPQDTWPAVHIAGTNGKGSTAAFIYNILKEAGLRVGLYTSPHLVDFSERIRINDVCISWKKIVEYTRRLKPIIEEIKPTFFEATTALAFLHFANEKIDIAVVETGLGGRLDATNRVKPVVTVITPVDIDHAQFLGNTLGKIAEEKAGIIKPGIPCVTNNTDAEVLKIFAETCEKQKAPLYCLNTDESIELLSESIRGSRFNIKLPDHTFSDLNISLAGHHQLANALLGVATVLHIPNLNLTSDLVRRGLHKTRWPGRLQIVREQPLTMLDVAHNPHGFRNIDRFLQKHFTGKPIWVLLGLSWDKDFRVIADIVSNFAEHVGIVDNFSEKQVSVNLLSEAFKKKNTPHTIFNSFEEGYSLFSDRINAEGLILIAGSHYLAEKFYKRYKILDF
ncbi:MAG: folylpolyglutamate synthase/dihydrofolate synthase family protein [Calditrichia bacterium]